jgi:hypothetical protein
MPPSFQRELLFLYLHGTTVRLTVAELLARLGSGFSAMVAALSVITVPAGAVTFTGELAGDWHFILRFLILEFRLWLQCCQNDSRCFLDDFKAFSQQRCVAVIELDVVCIMLCCRLCDVQPSKAHEH